MSRKAKGTVLSLLFILLTAAALSPGGASTAEAASPAEGVIEHEVRGGDSLMLLAGYYYKDPRQWKRIYTENRSALADPSVIRTGAVLRIVPDPARQWNIPYADYLSRVFD